MQETASGDVRGTTANNGVRGFYAVPYAQNTIGSMRFKPPKPVVPWANETLDATLANDRHIKCPQFSINDVTKPFVHYVGDEDCLTLDFFVGGPVLNCAFIAALKLLEGGGSDDVVEVLMSRGFWVDMVLGSNKVWLRATQGCFNV